MTENTQLVPERVEEYPNSAKLAVAALKAADEPLTVEEICDRTTMPQRTARYGLDQLVEDGVVSRRPNVRDARQWCYRLVGCGGAP